MIRIITDSASDITQAEAKKLGITVIPLKVSFKDEEFIDGVTIDNKQFFEKLIECDTIPKTSQLVPFDYIKVFDEVKTEDEAIVISLSKELSGTYNNACVAASDYDNIHVVDGHSVTIGQRILVLRALELTKTMNDVNKIIEILEEEKKSIRLVALLDTLQYLKMGGRISPTTAFFGELLNIKPVVEIQDGKVVSTGKAKGSRNGNNKLRSAIDGYNGIDFNRPFAVAYSGLSDTLLNKYLEDSKDLYEGHDVSISLIGSVIGTHIGPGAIAVAFFSNEAK